MSNLSAQQAGALAANFLAIAQSIGDYRFANWDTLDDAQNKQLGSLQRSILNAGEDVLALSTVLIMDDVSDSLSKINEVTTQIKEGLRFLKNIQKVVNIAAAAASLGSGVLSKNPQTISNGISSLVDSWKNSTQ